MLKEDNSKIEEILSKAIENHKKNNFKDEYEARRINITYLFGSRLVKKWSGRRELNPRPKRWQRFALPLSYSRL